MARGNPLVAPWRADPVANPLAFAAHQRATPLDGKDLNRMFPGDPLGTVSERLARTFYELVIGNAQFLYTLHSRYATGEALPHVEFQDVNTPVRNASLTGARVCSLPFVRATDGHCGLFPRAVSGAGVPAIEAEIGGGIISDVYRGVTDGSIPALMRHLEMLPGETLERPHPVVCGSVNVIATKGGLLRVDTGLGSRIAKDQEVGVITDLFGHP